MKKLLLLATTLLSILPVSLANACSCLPRTPQQNFQSSEAVFSGRVINITNFTRGARQSYTGSYSSSEPEAVQVIFEVSKVWKGKSNQNLVVRTAANSAMCGYNFQQGQEYLVYADEAENKLVTGLCNGTKPLSMAQSDLGILGEGKSPNNANSALEKLRRNQQLWLQQNIRNYRYRLQVSCHCLPSITQPVVIEVHNGVTTSIKAVNKGIRIEPEFFKNYKSIDKLFRLVQKAIAEKAHRIDVTYHPTLGYPTQINIDYDAQMADEELYLTIDNFEVIK
jgi:hypothetical protein